MGSLLYQGAGHLLNSSYALGGREEPPPCREPLPVERGSAGEGKGVGEPSASLPMRLEDFLNFRLKRVTFDLSQPPYDSLQTYEFEGRGSRAGSLSSLESEEAGEEEGGGGMAALNQKFQRLVEIIRERESEMEGDKEGREEEAVVKETDKQEQELENKEEVEEEVEQRWDF